MSPQNSRDDGKNDLRIPPASAELSIIRDSLRLPHEHPDAQIGHIEYFTLLAASRIRVELMERLHGRLAKPEFTPQKKGTRTQRLGEAQMLLEAVSQSQGAVNLLLFIVGMGRGPTYRSDLAEVYILVESVGRELASATKFIRDAIELCGSTDVHTFNRKYQEAAESIMRASTWLNSLCVTLRSADRGKKRQEKQPHSLLSNIKEIFPATGPILSTVLSTFSGAFAVMAYEAYASVGSDGSIYTIICLSLIVSSAIVSMWLDGSR